MQAIHYLKLLDSYKQEKEIYVTMYHQDGSEVCFYYIPRGEKKVLIYGEFFRPMVQEENCVNQKITQLA